MMTERRRFPPPWTVEDNGACFIVNDKNGQALAYVYYEEEPGRRAAAHLLTRDEAHRIAANIAKIPQYRRGGATVVTGPNRVISKSPNLRTLVRDRGRGRQCTSDKTPPPA
jgi:hypothetical protein